jgi:hypothetical protein
MSSRQRREENSPETSRNLGNLLSAVDGRIDAELRKHAVAVAVHKRSPRVEMHPT